MTTRDPFISFRRAALCMALCSGFAAAQLAAPPIVVAVISGFNAGANNGMTALRARLVLEFANGSQGAPAIYVEHFTYLNVVGAANWMASYGTFATRVIVGHSFGGNASHALHQTYLAPQGLDVALQVSIDHVVPSSPFGATTISLPAGLPNAYHYFQTSTSFLEPVPVLNIVGTKRNVNAETLCGDAGVTHTSIDDDVRIHSAVVEHVRDLFAPNVFPSTGERLDMLTRIDTLNTPCVATSGIAAAGHLRGLELQPVAGGRLVTLRTVAPEGDFAGVPFGIIGQFVPTPLMPQPILPGLASDLTQGTIFLVTTTGLQSPPSMFAPLPAPGFSTSFCWPTGLSGFSLLVQGVAVTTAAANGLYATSGAIELRGI